MDLLLSFFVFFPSKQKQHPNSMPTINIHREKYIIKNVIQKWCVYVDDHMVAKVPDDDVISFTVAPGYHEMQIGGATPFYPFARKWMRSNSLVFYIGDDDILDLRTAFHPLWNLSYRKPDLLHPSKCLVLYPLNENSIKQLSDNTKQLSIQYKYVLKAAHTNKWDIIAHVCCMLAFISLPIFFKDSFQGLLEWFGFCFAIGIITLLSDNKAYVLAGRNAFLSFTILLGYRNAYTNSTIAVVAAMAMILFLLRYIQAYRQFRKMNELIKEKDCFFDTLKLSSPIN